MKEKTEIKHWKKWFDLSLYLINFLNKKIMKKINQGFIYS